MTGGLGTPPSAEAASAGQPVAVALDTLSPSIPATDSTVSLGGTLRLTGRATGPLVVQLQVSRVSYRDNMNDPRRGDDPDASTLINTGHDEVTPVSGSATPWRVSVPATAMFGRPGVYAVDVEVVGAPTSSEPGQDLGDVWTYLPWHIDQLGASHTQVAMVWPLTAVPTVDGNQVGNQNGGSRESFPELTDDSLARDVAPGGRLADLLAGSRNLHVSWAVDPDLLDTVATMASGYAVRAANGTANPGSGTAAARAWLTQAKEVIGGVPPGTSPTGTPSGAPTPGTTSTPNTTPAGPGTQGTGTQGANAAAGETGSTDSAAGTAALAASSTAEVWTLPYADPDLDSLAGAPARLQTQVTVAADYRPKAVADQLGVTPRGVLAWPAGGQAGSAALRLAAARLKPGAVLLSGDSLPVRTPDDLYTPTGRTSVDGMPAAVSDPALDAVLDGDPADTGNGAGSAPGLLAGQRYIAETALISAQLQTDRAVVVQAPRDFAPSTDLLAALRDVASGRWVGYVGLSKVLHTAADPNATVGLPTRSAVSRSADRSTASLARVSRFQGDLASFASILTAPDRVTAPYDPVILRALSTSWRGRNGAAGPDAFLAAASGGPEGLETQRSEVSMVPKSGITLSGRSGSLPITIVNNLAQQVRLRLVITSGRPDLLRITPHPTLTIDPGSQQIVQISAHASGSGVVVPVHVRLLTPAGGAYGAAQDIQVRVTNIGAIGLVILLVSAGLVVLAVVLRLYRAARRRRGTGGPAGGSGTGPGSGEGDDTPTPGDQDASPRDGDTTNRGSFVPPRPEDVHNGETDGRHTRP